MKEQASSKKSAPNLALGDRCIAVIGMNGVGKSSFGKSLASALKLQRIDTDTEFRKLHGKEQAYIDAHGWEAFRKAEEEIVRKSLLPHHVVVLGGGAIESLGVHPELKTKAIVVWIQGGRKQVRKNLTRAKVARPEFGEQINAASVKDVMDQRTPHYENLADVVLYPHLQFRERVPKAIELLGTFMTNRNRES